MKPAPFDWLRARTVDEAVGALFAAEGGLDRFVRIPWTRPAEELRTAVARLAEVWQALPDTPVRQRPGRVLVA